MRLQARLLWMMLPGLCSCLDFNQCKACVDAGGTCAVTNRWPSSLSATSGTSCTSLDAGLVDGGGEGSATCGFSSPQTGPTWGVYVSFPSPGAGRYICSRAELTSTNSRHVDLNLHCGNCSADAGICGCAQDPGCVLGAWTAAGSATVSGPFKIPSASCNLIEVSLALSNPDAGELVFDQAWLWETGPDAGCTWNEAAQCPGP